MKTATIIILAVILSACSTFPNIDMMKDLKPGVSRSEFMERFGDPVEINFIGGWYVLTYDIFSSAHPMGRGYDFFFDDDDVLYKWTVINPRPVIRSTGVVVGIN